MRIFAPCLISLALFGGCASTIALRTPWERVRATQDSAAETAAKSGVTAASDASKKAANKEVDQVAATLQKIEGLDGESRAALASDLEKVPPSLRPLVLSQLEAVANRGREEPAAQENKPAPPTSPATVAHTKKPAAEPVQPAPVQPPREEQATGVQQTACVECEDAPIAREPTKTASRNTSPFDRLAALARAEEREPTVRSPKITGAVERVAATATVTPANRGTAIQRATEPAAGILRSDNSRSWRNALDEAIEKLEAASPSEAPSPDEVADLARLRLLQLAAGKRSEALAPIPALSAEADAFFTKTLFGLDAWLDNRRIAESDRRAAAALPHLTEAIGHLGEVAPLSVRNLQLCTAVQSFGVVEPFKSDSFLPGQEVLVYAEVENFHSEETAEGFETALEGSILIFDSRGRRVAEIDLPKKEDRCNRRRRDFFLVYQVSLPERLYPGSHSLKLTVEDAGCHKIGQSTLKFAISDESE